METFLIQHESAIRLGAFLGILAAMGTWEALMPRRSRLLPHGLHWLNNLALTVINGAVLRVALPSAAAGGAAVSMAAVADERSWGLLRQVEWAHGLEILLALVLLDLAIYLQHVAVHRVPLLWRIHRVHHTDLDLDASSGGRFHPLEILISMLWKMTLVIALGASPVSVILFELVLNGMAVFNHANVSLPLPVDRVLRTLLVTPDVHRVHHSVLREETDSNFGFNLSVWDRVFRTYRAQPAEGHEGMTIGLSECRDPQEAARLTGMLTMPFR